MADSITISGSVIAALIICVLLCILIPLGALIIYKKKNRDIKAMNAFWGGLAFVVFALVLEQLLHLVMLPVVRNNIWIYALYGAFAAGIFEETARFLVFKTIMKKDTDPRNSIMYGIGHGGVESALVVGVGLINFAIIGILVNAVGVDAALKMTGATTETMIAAATQQITALQNQSVGMCFVSVFERVMTMVFHVALSVWVFRAAREKGKIWLYPAAILMHAAVDFPAALYQVGFFPLWVTYVFMVAIDAVVCFIAYINFKAMKKTNSI